MIPERHIGCSGIVCFAFINLLGLTSSDHSIAPSNYYFVFDGMGAVGAVGAVGVVGVVGVTGVVVGLGEGFVGAGGVASSPIVILRSALFPA